MIGVQTEAVALHGLPSPPARQSASEAQRQQVKGRGCRLGRSVENIRQLESRCTSLSAFEGSLACLLDW